MGTFKTAPDHNITGWPGGIRYIIGNEGCERFSYYGMRAILYFYIIGLYINLDGMGYADAKAAATDTYHTFSAGVYALPMIGALIADRLLGKYRTILWLSCVYCLGHVVLAVGEGTMWGLISGLVLIAIGSGGIKPCVSAHVGDQFGKGNWHLIQKVYNAFYFIINFGSAFATLLIPAIRGDIGQMQDGVCKALEAGATMQHEVCYTSSVSWAFAVPGILMGLATIFFWMGRRKFIHVPPTHPPKLAILDVLALSALFMSLFGWWAFLMPLWKTSALVHILISVGFFVIFLAIFVHRQRIELDDGPLVIVLSGLFPKLFKLEGEDSSARPGFFGAARARFGDEAVDGTISMLRIIGIFGFVSVFWALFDQHSSTWLAQAKDMGRDFVLSDNQWVLMGGGGGLLVGVGLYLSMGKLIPNAFKRSTVVLGCLGVGALLGSLGEGSFSVQASQVPAVNPFMVMILIPLTTFGLYPLMDKLGFKPTPLRRMTIGMLMASLSFVSVALIQSAMAGVVEITRPDELLVFTAQIHEIHVIWQIIPYFILTLSEVMVSITGLEFGYSQAPKRLKSVVMGFWLLCVALGNKLVAILSGLKGMDEESFFWLFAILMGAAGLLFGLIASFYTYKDRTQ